jgi:hypothetical protein
VFAFVRLHCLCFKRRKLKCGGIMLQNWWPVLWQNQGKPLKTSCLNQREIHRKDHQGRQWPGASLPPVWLLSIPRICLPRDTTTCSLFLPTFCLFMQASIHGAPITQKCPERPQSCSCPPNSALDLDSTSSPPGCLDLCQISLPH